MSRLECQVLGPVEVRVAGRRRELGPPRQRVVFAVLLSSLDRPIGVSELADRVWAEPAPQTGADLIYGYVSGLRRALAEVPEIRVVRQSRGYRLQADPANVDLYRFRQLLSAAAAARDAPAGGDGGADRLLSRAVALWRGPAFGDLSGPWLEQQRAVLERERLSAMLDLNDLQLRRGQAAAALPRLQELAVTERLDERVAAQFMLATYHCGRPAEALSFYRTFQQRLADELGADPGPQLQAVHQAILRGEPGPTSDRERSAPAWPSAARAARPAPAQLPAAVPGFTGRHAELAELHALVARSGPAAADGADGSAATTAVAISTVSGTAGVGKTALVVHWAHRVAPRFPDGQLYVDLRGFHRSGQVVESAAAVRGFLTALGVPADRIPTDPDAQVALYRSLLYGRRLLVVVDNARDAEHARPLLPGTPTAVAVVTSRSPLTDLVAADGAHPLPLGLLSTVEARQLLECRLGPGRVAAEPDAVEQIITACARLPLALALVAARAAAHPTFPLAAVADELAHAADNAPSLADTDHVITRVRAVFSWSYATLTPAAARLFRLLGLHPGPAVSAAAAASLAALPLPQTRALLGELTRTGLATEKAPGRYGFHDLLAAYATHLGRAVDSDQTRQAATFRLLDHYIHTAHAASRLQHPTRDPIPLTLTPPAPGTSPERPTDLAAATGWLDTEWPILLAALRLAAGTGLDTRTWQLAWTLDTYLDRQGRWHHLAAAWQTALRAARRLGNPAAVDYAYRCLGFAHFQLRCYADADTYLRCALDMSTRAGDPASQAASHRMLASVLEMQGHLDQALDHARQALTRFRSANHQPGQAYALGAVGWYHALLGDHHRALVYCQQARALHLRVGNAYGEAHTWDSLGYIHRHLTHHRQALDCYQRAATLFHGLADRYHEALVLNRLGDTHHTAGHLDAARTTWQQALTILTDLGHPDADAVRRKLHRRQRQGPLPRRFWPDLRVSRSAS